MPRQPKTGTLHCSSYMLIFLYFLPHPRNRRNNNTTNKLCTDLFHEQIQISCWQWIIIRDEVLLLLRHGRRIEGPERLRLRGWIPPSSLVVEFCWLRHDRASARMVRGKCHLRAFNTNVHHCHGPCRWICSVLCCATIRFPSSSFISVRCGKHSVCLRGWMIWLGIGTTVLHWVEGLER